MIAARHAINTGLECLDSRPAVTVEEAEYRRLLGYPKDHVPGERVEELSAWARSWYAEHGRPWVYVREAKLRVTNDGLQLDGMDFRSKKLHEHLRQTEAQRAVLVVVSAGRECEDYARQLWQEGKPDEYFFLEMFGSAVVENLVANLSGRICELAAAQGLITVPHYSPGYTGWDVADQNKLFGLIAHGITRPFPGPIEVMSSGMLNPKKSMLAVFGLRERPMHGATPQAASACESCAFSPCQFRRATYRHHSADVDDVPDLSPVVEATLPSAVVKYSVGERALRKWAEERVRLEYQINGAIEAHFRYDGTTCSNQGLPLAFDYTVSLSAPAEHYKILRAECRPVVGDAGYMAMCAYLNDSEALMQSIREEKPLLGRPLTDVFNWNRAVAPAGCHCSAESRAHKWGLALEAIHFALTQVGVRVAAHTFSHSP